MAGRKLEIAVIAGDGIGQEVVPAAIEVLEKAGARHGLGFNWTDYPWGCDHYARRGQMMPPDGLDRASAPRCDLSGGRGATGCARSRLAVGPVDPDPPPLPPVHQPAAGQAV